MRKEDLKKASEEEWLVDFMERELNQDDMRRAMMVLETTPKLRGKLNELMLIKESLMHSQRGYRNETLGNVTLSEVNFDSLHNRIMSQIENIETKKNQIAVEVKNKNIVKKK